MERRTKVLHLVSRLDGRGGLELMVALIVSHLDKKQFEAEIWCLTRGGRLTDEFKRQGLTVKVLGISNYFNPLNILKLAFEFRRANADIIHTHIYFASTIGRLAGTLAGVKVLINHVHSAYGHYSPQNLWIERFLSRITRKIICVSKYVKDFVVNHEKIDPSKVEIVYNGISRLEDLSKEECRKSFGVKDRELVITIVANLLENKGHIVLFKSLSLMARDHPDLKCWVVGEGPLRLELGTQAKSLNIDSQVVFWGVREDIPQIVTASDIFVLPSIQREGLSIAVIEAMAYGTPVIVSDLGGLTEMIDHQQNGLLVHPQDDVSLKNALEEMMADPQKRAFLAREARKKYEQYFHVTAMVSKIEKIYKDCL